MGAVDVGEDCRRAEEDSVLFFLQSKQKFSLVAFLWSQHIILAIR